MKIRNGFVSNSSSSSFCIYGISMEPDEMTEKLQKLGLMGKDDNNIYEWPYCDKGKILEQNNIKIESGHPDAGYIYFGREWKSIKDNETGKEFKENVEKSLNKIFKEDMKCFTYEEAWSYF